jgi:hypothetical protein
LHTASKPHEVELRKHLMTGDFTSSQGESHGFLQWSKLLYRKHIWRTDIPPGATGLRGLRQGVNNSENQHSKAGFSIVYSPGNVHSYKAAMQEKAINDSRFQRTLSL